MVWNCIEASVIGTNHIKEELPLQDSIMTMKDRDYLYVSIADGHGSPLCFRSDVGSNLAVLSAIEIIQHQSRNITSLTSQEERELACKNVLQAVYGDWNRKVLSNLKLNPFDSEQLDKLELEDKKRLSTNALLAYGSTLSLIVINKNMIFGFSLGDADVLTKKDEKIIILDKEQNKEGEERNSLSEYDSMYSGNYFEYDSEHVDFLIISTSPYRSSFDSDSDFKDVIINLHKILNEKGEKYLRENLRTLLSETSEAGSGDDISLCFLYK